MHQSSLFKKVSRFTYLYTGSMQLELEMGVITLFMQEYPDMGHALYDIEMDMGSIVLTVFPTQG